MYCVEISKIEYHPSSKGYILILKKNDSDLEIPILIGSNEAQSLSLAYEDIRLPRPTSHDLIINLINEFDGKIESVIIKKYEKGTFFCSIIIKKDSIKLEIDSRPSDAITIALKNLIPIYIRKNVIEKVNSKSIIEMQHFPEKINDSKNQYNNKNIINNLMGALDKAVNEENYEIAAKLRDRIKKLKTNKIN